MSLKLFCELAENDFTGTTEKPPFITKIRPPSSLLFQELVIEACVVVFRNANLCDRTYSSRTFERDDGARPAAGEQRA